MKDISDFVPPVEIPASLAEPVLWGNTLRDTVAPGTSPIEEVLGSEESD